MKIDIKERDKHMRSIAERMDAEPYWARPNLTRAARKTAAELLRAAELEATKLVAFNAQMCAWMRSDLDESGLEVSAPPEAEVLTAAARVSLNLRMASIIARGELQIEIAQRLEKIDDSIQPTIFPLAIRPEPITAVRYRERDRGFAARAKKYYKDLNGGKLKCECCGLDPVEFYGAAGERCLEAHHRIPIEELQPDSITRVDEMAIVCASCHRMIHSEKPCIPVEQLAQKLAPQRPPDISIST